MTNGHSDANAMTSPSDIAIVGMACCYPDARSPDELWRNVLAQRRAFRRVPPERLRFEDYAPGDRTGTDSISTPYVAVIEGWEFDRARFRIAGPAFRAADTAHWLALDVASRAFVDAGFADPAHLPRESTGVVLGNSLTGEFSRASTLRLRWPYVRRMVDAALRERGQPLEERHEFLSELEVTFKAPFPEVGDETLAGGLSNTIAGRICNQFDLKGGGYTVDGACASSLLAVTTACSSLVAGDLDVALAGGVDLSLDPFELVGFSRLGALAPELMRVYDARSAGFWPGEGCGFVVLMRHADALARGLRVYAVVRGWGVASDGSGGITRPEVEGQLLAVRRAYRRAGYGPDSVVYFEGHGTGTTVGDAVELEVLSRARREADPAAEPAALGSVKANIGHTKAAAGIAGLIKATLAVHNQIRPPTTGCFDAHPSLTGACVRVLRDAEPWPAGKPLRAAVSAMGFGGIDTHLTLEGAGTPGGGDLDGEARALASTYQDCELFLFGAETVELLREAVERTRRAASRISFAELGDLAAALARLLRKRPRCRAAVVAGTPDGLESRLAALESSLAAGAPPMLDVRRGVYFDTGESAPRLGYLFTGQGSPAHLDGGLWRRRFESVRALYDNTVIKRDADPHQTAVAQPAIVTASLSGLQTLAALGLAADVAIGHSLGELTAYHWAGAFDAPALVRLAAARGGAMGELGSPGAMASLATDAPAAERLIAGGDVVVAGLNAPNQTVIAGDASAVEAVIALARAAGVAAVRLPVTRAFHSPLVAAAVPALAAHLAAAPLGAIQRRVFSTVTGGELEAAADLAALLLRQVTAPVRFSAALQAADSEVDLWLEVGPGQTLRTLASGQTATPVIALDAASESLVGLLNAAGAAWALGSALQHEALFATRFVKPFDLDRQRRFLANPCEQAPLPDEEGASTTADAIRAGAKPEPKPQPAGKPAGTLELVRRLVAERIELPVESVSDQHRLLGDLHLNSIVVGQVAVEAATRLGLPPPADPTAYAGATVGELARALEELSATHGTGTALAAPAVPAGVDAWVRPFVTRWLDCPGPGNAPASTHGVWSVFASPGDPLAGAIERALGAKSSGEGVIVILPPEPDERCATLLLEAARALWPRRTTGCFVVVQCDGGGGGFARSLHLESPETATCIVDVPRDDPRVAAWVADEAQAASGFRAVAYGRDGIRREPVLAPGGPLLHAPLALGPDDVLLVTGGGKGIAAECALGLARKYSVRLGLVGRAHPDTDSVLAQNLERFRASGVRFHYAVADVAAAERLRDAVGEIEAALGPVTGVLHGAGTNIPRPLSALDAADFLATAAPKLAGARNLAAAVDASRLKLFVAFGSIIARTGMRGEADYAAANEWLAGWVRRFQADHPACRCLTIEWSVWSGAGMGERLGRLEALVRDGITPIPVDVGVQWLGRLIDTDLPDPSILVAGRFGVQATLKLEAARLPLWRFLEQPRVLYPGIELVVDVELSRDSDPYLADHTLAGDPLFPAVLGLEAMAEAAMAITGATTPPVFEAVEFARPIVVPRDGTETIRVAALVREPGVVDVALRASRTQFQVDHFRARCRFNAVPGETPSRVALAGDSLVDGRLAFEPEADLYGSVLFQDGRFRRVSGYRWLRATECLAEISADGATAWFGTYLPASLVLGDPGARDAAIHALQACIPHRTLLPIAIERLEINRLPSGQAFAVRARERHRDGDTFIYDLEITTPDGAVLEHWSGLTLRAVGPTKAPKAWSAPLLAPYLQRRLDDLVPGLTIGVALQRDGAAGSDDPARAFEVALARRSSVVHRPDGKPELPSEPDLTVSVSHAGALMLAVAGAGTLGCDVEPVVERPSDEWHGLLGAQRYALAVQVARESGENLADSLTRVWTVIECLKKAGVASETPILLRSTTTDGWVMLAAGDALITTFVGVLQPAAERLAFAVFAGGRHAGV